MSEIDAVTNESSGSVSITRERKPFPIAPKGEFIATCVRAKVEERMSDNGPYMSLSLMWELDGQAYKDDQGGDRHHVVFTSYGLSFGPRAKLHQVLKALTGRPPVFTQKTEKRGDKSYVTDEFNYKMFVGMKAQVMVAHKDVSGKMYANVVDLSATLAMQQHNIQFLPEYVGEVKDLSVFQGDTVTAKRTLQQEQPSDLGFEESKPQEMQTVLEYRKDVDAVIKAIGDCKTKEGVDTALAIMVEGAQYSPEDMARIDEAVKTMKALLPA